MSSIVVQKNQPHIVKFSGGRSSGMMLMQLLEGGKLIPERGDVILFNNTSAEHPATYEFARKMKALAEQKYNIPFFGVEYQTYEDAAKHGWRRHRSYRLVNDRPYDKENNPDGYHFGGEVYEEMVALKGFLPNMQTRICTQELKIFVTNAFLADWFAQKSGIDWQGHYGDAPRMSDADCIDLHEDSGGSTPPEILLEKRRFVRGRNFVREEKLWQDFTRAKLCFDNEAVKKSVIGDKGQLFGDHPISYVSYLGIRGDEKIRVEKIKARIEAAQQNPTRSMSSQPTGETVLAPLVDAGVTQQQVIAFWAAQDFDLDLPQSGNFSNCVYCPLKGKKKLLQVATDELTQNGSVNQMTPASIDWWIRMEEKYSRDLRAENRKVTSENKVNYVGFFGATEELIYSKIKNQAQQNLTKSGEDISAEFLEEENYIPCNCTD